MYYNTKLITTDALRRLKVANPDTPEALVRVKKLPIPKHARIIGFGGVLAAGTARLRGRQHDVSLVEGCLWCTKTTTDKEVVS